MAVSRRKPIAQSAVPGTVTIRVVCTDKGQHPDVSFGHVTAWQDGDGWRVTVDGLNHRGDVFTDLEPIHRDQIPDRLHKTYPLECRRCGRNVPLRAETLDRVIAALAAAEKRTFDLSDLP